MSEEANDADGFDIFADPDESDEEGGSQNPNDDNDSSSGGDSANDDDIDDDEDADDVSVAEDGESGEEEIEPSVAALRGHSLMMHCLQVPSMSRNCIF